MTSLSRAAFSHITCKTWMTLVKIPSTGQTSISVTLTQAVWGDNAIAMPETPLPSTEASNSARFKSLCSLSINFCHGRIVRRSSRLSALGSLLSVNSGLLTHGGEDDNVCKILLAMAAKM